MEQSPDILRVAGVFEKARDAPIGELDALLSFECGGDPALEREVRDLLAHAIGAPSSPIGQPDQAPLGRILSGLGLSEHSGPTNSESDGRVPGAGATENHGRYTFIAERVGDFVGDFVLERIVGEGSVGTVWLARNLSLPEQRTAIKIIRPGMDSRAIVARFRQEQRVLARMEHPGIARVIGAGLTSFGRPYFAMEFIDGSPITAFCDEARLDVHARIELLAAVCDAVQHAHRRGVLHRDLKPSNILVSATDTKPVATIIDFGIAKALTADDATATALTLPSSPPLGTPSFMSPEQVRDPSCVDVRTDVYALGAVLYELLCGSPPHAPARDQPPISLARMLERVCTEDPSLPSALLSRAAPTNAHEICSKRATTRDNLARALAGELDWVVRRAMARDPGERYSSPEDFASDLRSYTSGRAVRAAPPSIVYRARKFGRLHHRALLIGSCVLALLVGGAIVSWRATSKARDARVDFEQREGTADLMQALIYELAGQPAAQHELVASTAQAIFKDQDPVRRGLLIDASREGVRASLEARVQALIDTYFSENPFAQTTTYSQAARAGEGMSAYHESLRLAEKACAAASTIRNYPLALLIARTERARMRQRLGDFESALAEYDSLRGEFQQRRIVDLHLWRLLECRATCLVELNRYDEADKAYEELGKARMPSYQQSARTMTITLRSRQGRHDEAVARALAEWQQSIDEHLPLTTRLERAARYAAALQESGCPDDSTRVLIPSIAEAVPALGFTHITTGTLMHTLARVLIEQGRGAEAIPWLERLDQRYSAIAPCHPTAIETTLELAEQLAAAGRKTEARALFQLAIERSQVFGPREELRARASRGLESLAAGGQ